MLITSPNLSTLADAVAALPRAARLSTRAVLVSSALGHAIRCALIDSGRGACLAGTRFLPPLAYALELLDFAGKSYRQGEDDLRPARLLRLFRTDLPMRHFPLALLRDNPGWEEAFARTIGDLEGAGLGPDALAQRAKAMDSDGKQLRDLVCLWRASNEDAGDSWSNARCFTEATALVAGSSRPAVQAVLAVVTGHESAVLAAFLNSIPEVRLALVPQLPLRKEFLERLEVLYGASARPLVSGGGRSLRGSHELDVLASGLFSPAEELSAKDRPRSRGLDGSVQLSEHAGVEEEVEAAADWVAGLVGAGVQLREIAVLFPRADPYSSLVSERLQRLLWPSGVMPVFVSGGLPCQGLSAGTRLLALVRALRSFLPIEQLPALLVSLRPAEGKHRLSHSDAVVTAGELGTVGGNAARPDGSQEWLVHARARLAALSAPSSADPTSKEARHAWIAEQARDRIETVLPALEALDVLAGLVVGRAALRDFAPALTAFCDAWLLQPGEGTPPARLLGAALATLAADPSCGALAGEDALRVVEEEVQSLRVPAGRYGEPAVFVGTVHAAAGLPFRAVRVLGLCEGALPSAPREDPVLPDALRRRLDVPALRTSAETTLSQLHALRRCVQEARDQVVLSTPRADADGSQRQPSSVFLDALAALGRPGSEPANLQSLRRFGFRPARASAEGLRSSAPVSLAAQLWSVARQRGGLPASWHSAPELNLERLRELQRSDVLEVLTSVGDPMGLLRGVTAERPISPSRLQALLGCPLAFFFSEALGWDGPAGLPSTGLLDSMPYGSLFHRVAELFVGANRDEFGSRARTLAFWQKRASDLADTEFDRACEQLPLAGDLIKDQQRNRLRRDVRTFIEHEWNSGHTPVLVEHSFGRPTPVRLRLASGTLHVSGIIDRIDREGDLTLVRDLKTGNSHARRGDEKGPTFGRDVQLGLYGLVVKQLADGLGLPKKLAAAYVYVDRAGERERAFRTDYAALEKETRTWLDTALQLLQERAFPPAPKAESCKWCSFRPVCGDETVARSKAALAASENTTLRAFASLFGISDEGEGA